MPDNEAEVGNVMDTGIMFRLQKRRETLPAPNDRIDCGGYERAGSDRDAHWPKVLVLSE